MTTTTVTPPFDDDRRAAARWSRPSKPACPIASGSDRYETMEAALLWRPLAEHSLKGITMKYVGRRNVPHVLLATGLLSAIVASGCAGDVEDNDLVLEESDWDADDGAVIDADRQLADVRAAQAVSDGTWASTPDPGAKAGRPETDLHAYPKFTDEQRADQTEVEQAAADSPASDAADVLSIETLADGSTSFSIYEPAPGITAEELADLLREQGKKGVQVVRHEPTPVGTNQANSCAYGQARSFRCPVAFWTNNGYADPLVRFNDHSGAAWPTDNAVYKWNQVANIDSWYRWNSCPFMAGARCVDVVSGNYGHIGWTGHFSGLFPPGATSGAFQEHGQLIQLNEYYPLPSHNNTVTHEIGHALGLGHNQWSGDVMYGTANTREDIGGENRVLLESIYSVYR
jgi:hypothetical protein